MTGARFVAAATAAEGLPDPGLPEVAFGGRSNVGKSSLVGMVLGRPALVRTSRTPGQTRTLNLFVLDNRLSVVDLPGYGWAKVSRKERAALATMTRGYLAERVSLRGVVLLLDARREQVSPMDREFGEWVLEAGRALLVVITKVDLVAKPILLHRARRIEQDLGVAMGAALLCSSKNGSGREELLRTLWEATRA